MAPWSPPSLHESPVQTTAKPGTPRIGGAAPAKPCPIGARSVPEPAKAVPLALTMLTPQQQISLREPPRLLREEKFRDPASTANLLLSVADQALFFLLLANTFLQTSARRKMPDVQLFGEKSTSRQLTETHRGLGPGPAKLALVITNATIYADSMPNAAEEGYLA
ncbi:hypothetical protein VUR80DRAFT_7904 [Thermomyces stellatus]